MTANREIRRAQFELERELHKRILDSDPATRAQVVAQAYDELFNKFPSHAVFQLTDEVRQQRGEHTANLISPLYPAPARILEVGCGRGDSMLALQRRGYECVGLEPSQRMVDICNESGTLKMVCGTAERLEFDDASFNVVFSQQVLEHVHPDDVPMHFQEAFRILKPGGWLAVETPNLRTGPQDISRGFVPYAEGLHLKEWKMGELVDEFAKAGFRKIQGLLAPPFLARRSSAIFSLTRVPGRLRVLEDYILTLVPGLNFRTFVGKLLGLDDLFVFARKP